MRDTDREKRWPWAILDAQKEMLTRPMPNLFTVHKVWGEVGKIKKMLFLALRPAGGAPEKQKCGNMFRWIFFFRVLFVCLSCVREPHRVCAACTAQGKQQRTRARCGAGCGARPLLCFFGGGQRWCDRRDVDECMYLRAETFPLSRARFSLFYAAHTGASGGVAPGNTPRSSRCVWNWGDAGASLSVSRSPVTWQPVSVCAGTDNVGGSYWCCPSAPIRIQYCHNCM